MNGRNSKSEILWKGLHYVKDLQVKKNQNVLRWKGSLYYDSTSIVPKTNKQKNKKCIFSLQNLSSILEQGYRWPPGSLIQP